MPLLENTFCQNNSITAQWIFPNHPLYPGNLFYFDIAFEKVLGFYSTYFWNTSNSFTDWLLTHSTVNRCWTDKIPDLVNTVFQHCIENSGLNTEILGFIVAIIAFLIPISLQVITLRKNPKVSNAIRKRFYNTPLLFIRIQRFPHALLFLIFILIAPSFLKGLGRLIIFDCNWLFWIELIYIILIFLSFFLAVLATGCFFKKVYFYSKSNDDFITKLSQEIETLWK